MYRYTYRIDQTDRYAALVKNIPKFRHLYSFVVARLLAASMFHSNHACTGGDTRISTAPIFSRYFTIFMHHTRLIFVYALDYTPRT